jgi:hypothetical protein
VEHKGYRRDRWRHVRQRHHQYVRAVHFVRTGVSPDFSAAEAMRGITSAKRERSIGAEWDGGVDLKEDVEEEEG